MRAVHSLLHRDDLARLVEAEYDVDAPVAVRLLRRGFNDTYLVTEATGARRVLRVYQREKYWIRSEADLRFELDLLRHLTTAGCSVSQPYHLRTGDLLGQLDAPEGERHFALFTFAAGDTAEAVGLDAEGLRSLGTTVAELHLAMDCFGAESRYHLDLDLLIGMALDTVEPYVAPEQAGDFAELRALGERLRAYMSGLDLPASAYGLIHADIHDANLHVTPDGGFVLFDFDHCGFGWRGYDLTNFLPAFAGPDGDEASGSSDGSDGDAGTGARERAAREREREREKWTAFLAGYECVRPLDPAERDALPAFAACREFWNLGDWLRAASWDGDGWVTAKLCAKTLRQVRRRLGPLEL